MSSHDGVPMIVTLTPNPSNDRTVTLAGPLERGAVQRVLSVTMQAGGKGVNISRALSAGLATEAVFPARPDDPFVTELLGGHRVPRGAARGRLRINLAITEPDGTTTKLNSPGAIVCGQPTSTTSVPPCSPERRRPPGSCWPDAAAGCSRRLVRRAGAVAARRAGPGGCRHPRGPARGPRRGSPDAAPDLMKPNGEELASFVGGDEETFEAYPAARDRRRPARRPGSRRGPGDPRRGRCLPGDRGRSLARHPSPDDGGQRPGGRLIDLFGYLWATYEAVRRPNGWPSPVPLAAPPAAYPGRRIRFRSRRILSRP